MPSRYQNCPIPLGKVTRNFGTMLLERAHKWPEAAVFAYRQDSAGYLPVSWSKLLADVASLAAFLQSREVERGDRIATFSANCYEMLAWELAVTSMGAVSVPVFAGYDVGNLDYILAHSEPKAILVSGAERLEKLKACSARPRIPTIVTSQPSAFTEFGECLGNGRDGDFADRAARVRPKDVCFIQYTSGTTGSPKGVMLTHRNIMSQQQALSKVWSIGHDSRFLSYLPWHHSFGGLFERFTALYQGATIYLEDSFGKNFDRLLDNWSQVKPTQFFSVPKIYIALVTEAKLSQEVKEILFHPELKFVFTAAAPLPRECAEYFQSHHVPVIEGWGLTETSPCCTLTPPGKERIHSYVGEPIPGNEIVVATDNEIYVKGPNVMKGYFKDAERTARAIDHYGWFKTGDLGELTEYGLRMICRVDGLFKLSNGEKVSSMMVENCLTISSQWIQHAIAVGAGENYVAALVFPNFRNLKNWAAVEGRELPEGAALATDPGVQALIAAEIRENFRGFQPKYMEVRDFVIIPKELSLEDGELTPTMKVIRHRVVEEFQEWIELIFRRSEHPEQDKYIVSVTGGRHADTPQECRPAGV